MARAIVSLALLIILSGCEKPKAINNVVLVEGVAVEGRCKEDHTDIAADYVGVGYRYRNIDTSKTWSVAIVARPLSLKSAFSKLAKRPEQYEPPHSVDIQGLGDMSGDSFVWHGISTKECDERPGDEHLEEVPDCLGVGYAATCAVAVSMRSNDKEKLTKWFQKRLILK